MAPKADDNGTAKSVNALVDLLSAAALDSIDNHLLDREAQHCVLELRQSRDSLTDDPQAWDREVEKLIRQLRESLRDTPERDIEDLQDPDELLRPSVAEREPDYVEPQPRSMQEEEENDDRRQYLERELSTTSYPKIGPGYSDSISVVSDLTMPTVVQGVEIHEEEKYLGLPMSIGFTPKPRSQLRRPSLENKSGAGGRAGGGSGSTSGGGGGGGGDRKDRRAAQQQLRPPSRRVVTRPGGAAANRRQNHQATMAHLKASTPVLNSGRSSKSDQKAAPVAMSVNDFPSLKDASRGGASEDTHKPQQRRGSERRSLLRKSNKYAASVSATASQRMLLARQEDVKKKRGTRRRGSTGGKDAFPDAEAFASPAPAPLTDDFGFLIGGEAQADPFAASAFNAEFPPTSSFDTTNVDHNNANISSNNSASNPFFPASSKDTKKKKGSNRRGSMTSGKPKK